MSHDLTTDYDALMTETTPQDAKRPPTALPTGRHANADVVASAEGNLGMVDFEGRDIADGPEAARTFGEEGTTRVTEDEPV